MKKFLIVFIFIFSSSFAETVPCAFSNCDKKYPEVLTRFYEANPKNNKPMILWLPGGSGQSFSFEPASKLEKKI